MARRAYTDDDRAKVRLALEINRGNIKATSRDTGVPYMTVKNWKDAWESDGVPQPVQEATLVPAQQFVDVGVQVRDAALEKIRELLPQATVKDLRSLVTIVGVLDDKVRLAQGLATSKQEQIHIHIDPETVGRQIGSFIGSVLESAQRREDIIDAEFEEQAEPMALLGSVSD